MAEDTNVAPAADATVPAPPADNGGMSPREAADFLTQWRSKQAEPAPAEPEKKEQPRVNGRFAAQTPESPAQAEEPAPEPPPSGTLEGDEPEELPPIDPPTSWTKAEKERFATLPHETQQYIAERERERETEIRRAQNDAAERSKSLEAKEKAAEEAKTRFEQAATRTLDVLQSELAKDFGDIKSAADLQKLAVEDPFRFIQFQARQQAIGEQARQVEQLQQQRATEAKQQFESWADEQDQAFDKEFTEFQDAEKGPKLREALRNFLVNDIGVPKEAIPNLWNNHLFRDAKTQKLTYLAYRFAEGQKKAAAAVATPKPPVLRPGTSTGRVDGLAQQIAAAEERLKSSRGMASLQAATELTRLKRAAATRR